MNQETRPLLQEILVTLAQRIRRERERKGMSQENFAEFCGLHRTAIGLLERGKTIPKLDTLLLVSHRLSLPISELLHRIEPWVRRSRKFWWLADLRKAEPSESQREI